MDIKFAIRIASDSKTFRYATKRVVVHEQGVGDIEYLPYITKISVPEMSISLDHETSVPTINMSVWDAYREIADLFVDAEYESLMVKVLCIIDGKQEGEYSGYMADVKHDSGVVSFTVRMSGDDEGGFPDVMFTHKTFEYSEVLSPSLSIVDPAHISGAFEVVEDTGWILEHSIINRTISLNNTPAGSDSLLLHRGWGDNTFTRRILDEQTGGYLTGANLRIFDGQTLAGNYAVHVADIQDSEWRPTGPEYDPILVHYTHIVESFNRLELKGIPTSGVGSISRPIKAGATITPAVREDQTHIASFMDLLGDNGRGSSIRAPRLFVRAKKNIPLSVDDAKLGVGFVDLGTRRKLTDADIYFLSEDVLSGVTDIPTPELPVYHRYHIDKIAKIVGGPHDGEYRLELVLNTSSKDPGQRYRIRRGGSNAEAYAFTYGSSQTNGENFLSKITDGIKIVRFVSYLNELHVSREVMEIEDWMSVSAGDTEGLGRVRTPRLEKSRFDMIRDARLFNRDIISVPNAETAEASNLDNLNNATGQFGVCKSTETEVVFTGAKVRVIEQCRFEKPPTIVDIALYDHLEIPETSRPHNYSLSNYFRFIDERPKSVLAIETSLERTSGVPQAQAFYYANSYRVKHSPVPENPTDLGKMFPIVYGSVNKVPLLHVISKKTSDLNNTTAGDDVYIYASHKCGVESALDITVHILKEDGSEGFSEDEVRDFTIAARENIIESPFPFRKIRNFIDQVRFDDGEYGTIRHGIGMEGYTLFLNPYHKAETFKSRQDDELYGIQLRGEEWNEGWGVYDPIYPIRNGVGNSTLYGSFNGWIDELGDVTGYPGGLIEHPMDIIKHYVNHYSLQGEVTLNTESMDIVKALTPKYCAGIYHNEKMNTPDFIDKICKQFGIYRFNKNGLFSFAVPILSRVNTNKPLSDGLNLIIGTKEESDGYKKVYNSVIYNYRKNWASGEFDAQIDLNPTNNFYCAQADKARAGRETLTVDADFVNSSAVAQEVATRMAEVNSARNVVYACEAKYVDGIRFVPGDIVPMTFRHYDLKDEPVMVVKVQEDFDTMKLEVVRFANLISK